MSKYATHNWYTLAFDADAIANVIPEDYGSVWEGDELSHAIEWMREYNEHGRTLFRVNVSVEAVDIEGVSPPQPGPDAERVERAAKAMYMLRPLSRYVAPVPLLPDAKFDEAEVIPFEELGDHIRQKFRDMARAALAAAVAQATATQEGTSDA